MWETCVTTKKSLSRNVILAVGDRWEVQDRLTDERSGIANLEMLSSGENGLRSIYRLRAHE